jgi:hypothetical protein
MLLELYICISTIGYGQNVYKLAKVAKGMDVAVRNNSGIVRVPKHHTMKAYRSGGKDPRILNLRATWRLNEELHDQSALYPGGQRPQNMALNDFRTLSRKGTTPLLLGIRRRSSNPQLRACSVPRITRHRIRTL